MARNNRRGDAFASEDRILLGVLTAIERDGQTSQRSISSELGVALGLANAYLKRCVRKGLIKIHQVPRRRYVYYLTPRGFTEKARLTGQYLSASFQFFRRSREQVSELLEQCIDRGWTRIAIAGLSDLAEIAILCAQDRGLKLVAIIDPSQSLPSFRGIPAAKSIASAGKIDAVILTDLARPDALLRQLESEISPERILAPALLRLRPRSESTPIPSPEAAE
jgi:DNA-binding MarR family transcriptional regulator